MKRRRRKQREPEAIKSITMNTEQAEEMGARFDIECLDSSDRILKMYTSGKFEVEMEFFEEYILYTLIEKETKEKFPPIRRIVMNYTTFYNPFSEVITFSEAQDLWGLGSSTLRKAVSDKRFFPDEIKKSGKTWLVTKSAMKRLYGEEKEMKKFEIYNGVVRAKTNKDVVELALESGLFEIKSQEKEGLDEWGQLSYHDAPYALVMKDEKEVGGYLECWGLDRKMTLKEALEDFDYLEEQRIIDILEACNIEYEIERDQS